VGLTNDSPRAHHFAPFLSAVAFGTDGLEAPLGWGQVLALWECPLAYHLPGAVHIKEDPLFALAIPESSHHQFPSTYLLLKEMA
jgi:hypothetical protein